jgi:hypothetical protein
VYQGEQNQRGKFLITYFVFLDVLAGQLSPATRERRVHGKFADLVFGLLGCGIGKSK